MCMHVCVCMRVHCVHDADVCVCTCMPVCVCVLLESMRERKRDWDVTADIQGPGACLKLSN